MYDNRKNMQLLLLFFSMVSEQPDLTVRSTVRLKQLAHRDFGVVRICHDEISYAECTFSALSVQHHSPTVHQTQFIGSGCSSSKSHPVVQHGALERAVDQHANVLSRHRSYSMKFIPLLHSPYNESLLLDCDTVVMTPIFVPNMRTALRKADLVWTTDWTPWMRVYVPLPTACSCIMAWQSKNSVHDAFISARARLRGPQPRDYINVSIDGKWGRPRWSDQEALWYEISKGVEHNLRITYLPEEYQCAMTLPTKGARWHRYECHVTHYHPRMLHNQPRSFFVTHHLEYLIPSLAAH